MTRGSDTNPIYVWKSGACIVGEIAGGGFMAVAVGVSDRLQVTDDM